MAISRAPPHRRRNTKSIINNPLQAGALAFLAACGKADNDDPASATPPPLPKRYTVYPPLLLLAPTAFAGPEWDRVLGRRSGRHPGTGRETRLWEAILDAFSRIGMPLTHVAYSAPIAPRVRVCCGGGIGDHDHDHDNSGNGSGGDAGADNVIDAENMGVENVVRSPNGMVRVYGDFGVCPEGAGAVNPDYYYYYYYSERDPEANARGSDSGSSASRAAGAARVARASKAAAPNLHPTAAALAGALWVRAVQNGGVVQCWAPAWSMFSRGNVKEKARIMGFGTTGRSCHAGGSGKDKREKKSKRHNDDHDDTRSEKLQELHHQSQSQDPFADLGSHVAVVDMFAGIGYFVFSYLARGVARVWAWELNGWSVEGMRRGAAANGWGCRIVQVDDDGRLLVEEEKGYDGGRRDGNVDGADIGDGDGNEDTDKDDSSLVRSFAHSLVPSDRVVVFHGDNRFAVPVLARIRQEVEQTEQTHDNTTPTTATTTRWTPIRHINLGLLPSSGGAWESAVETIELDEAGAWLHVHANIDVRVIETAAAETRAEIAQLTERRTLGSAVTVKCECRHVEQVKTYAPGVMHCVFDIYMEAKRT